MNLGVSWLRGPQAAGLTVRYVDSHRNDEVMLYVGARNLTDKDPPPLPSGRESVHRYNLRPGFDGFVHDIKGRTLNVRFRFRTWG